MEKGKEIFSKYKDRHGNIKWQYDYIAPNGDRFICFTDTLEEARKNKDKWLTKLLK